jgi:hypothetical protein
MYKIDKGRLRTILIQELKYKPYQADSYLRYYPDLIHDELSLAMDQWLKDRTVLHVDIEGFSIEAVMKTRRCHFPMAVRELDLLKDADLTPALRDALMKQLSTPPEIW